jgi:hypothetical protein
MTAKVSNHLCRVKACNPPVPWWEVFSSDPNHFFLLGDFISVIALGSA